MPEWLYEVGIGEARAALVDDGMIVEARIEPDDGLPRVGAVVAVRLIARDGRRGTAKLIDGMIEGIVDPVDPALTIGSVFVAEVVREAVPEPGARKRMKLRAANGRAIAAGPDLRARIMSTGYRVRECSAFQPDVLELAGWSEVIEEAASGQLAFPGGALRISLTPAMTLIDVDGPGAPLALAMAGARAATAAIRRFDITGSIGIDLPTVGGRAERAAIADMIDRLLPQPFERTAVNGFGFIQIVRPRFRASLCEILRFDPARAAARALIRRAERSGLTGSLTLSAAPAVIAALEASPAWLSALSRKTGGAVILRADALLPMSGGDASRSR